MLNLTTQQDIEDFTHGCCFYGTGGGGPADFGRSMLMDALAAGKKIQIIEQQTLDDQDWIVCPYLMGTSGPETEEIKQAKLKHGLSSVTVGNMPAAAAKLLLAQSVPSVQLSAIIPYEIGGAATASAVATAAWLDVPTIDADFVGRSVPEATQMLPAIHGMDLCPTTSSDAFGNETIIHKSLNRMMVERIGKHIAQASFGLIGQATLLRQIHDLRKFMLTGTLSKAFSVGKALRLCRDKQHSAETNLRDLIGAKKLFAGIITEFTGDSSSGYYVGDIIIQGSNNYKNSQLKIWFKNENHVAWLNENVCLTSPDLISIIDEATQMPLVNNQLKNGMAIEVYGTPCHPAWHEKAAIDVNCPEYYGLNLAAKLMDDDKR